MSPDDARRTEIRFSLEGDLFDVAGLNRSIKSNIGSMCYVSRMPEDEDDFIQVGVMRDEIILDSTNRPRVHLRRMDDVFNGYCTDGDFGRVVVFPSLDDICERYDRSYRRITEGYENCAVETFGSRILRIPTVRNQMNPLFEIVDTLTYTDSFGIGDLDGSRWRKRKGRYLSFLEDKEIIRIEGDTVVPGRLMEKEIEGGASDDDVYSMIVDSITERDFFMLQEHMGIGSIGPYLRMSNANCMTSLVEDRPLRWDWHAYSYYLRRIYGDSSTKTTIISNAASLRTVGIFDAAKASGETSFYCEESLFDSYRDVCRRRVRARRGPAAGEVSHLNTKEH